MNQDKVADTWERGNPYEQYVGRWSRRIAPLFLAWLQAPPGRRWLDVGCGTGALCAAIVDECAPSWVGGVEPSDGFRRTAQEHLAGKVALYPGSASAIPLDTAAVDMVVSALVLNFVPDPRAALAEMARVARPGGVIAAYVWDYAGKMELMRRFWDAAAALDPKAAALDEGKRFPVCDPDMLLALFAAAGLAAPQVTALDIATPFASFDEYWRPFLGGQGPAPAYAMSLDAAARDRLREHMRERMPAGAIALTARAWAIKAGVPG